MIEALRLADIHRLDSLFEAAAGPGHPASALKPGVVSARSAVIVGVDGYLFISNSANLWERQYLGEAELAPGFQAAWTEVLARRQAEAVSRGVTLVNLVAPEKQVVYPDKRWPDQLPDAERRPLIPLLAGLGPEARIIYPAAALQALRATAPAYYRHNSHWTVSGCAAAVDLLLEAMDAPVRTADLMLVVRRTTLSHDLTAHLFTEPPLEEALAPFHPGERLDDNHQIALTGRNTGASYRLRNPAAPDARKVVVFGDSYAYDAGLTGLLAVVFAEVLFVWSRAVDWDLVAAEQAQAVVWEGAERFMSNVPTA